MEPDTIFSRPDTFPRISGLGTEHVELVIHGNQMLPVYRHGDRLVVSKNAPIKDGDRVVAKRKDGSLFGGNFLYRNNGLVVIAAFRSSKGCISLPENDLEIVGRILWASQ